MLLAIDVGNTYISFALFENADSCITFSKIAVSKNRTSDEYAVIIKQILDFKLPCGYSIDSVAVSSVAPTVTAAVCGAGKILSGCDPYIIGPGTKTGFKIAINDPGCLGSDIVSNVAAALDMYSAPLIVFDSGTANTITVIDESRTIIGTVILSGIRISAEALNDNAELLESVKFANTDIPLIGKTTDQSVLSGLIYGNALMLDGYVRTVRETIFSKDAQLKPSLVATGTYGRLITESCRNKFVYDELLTLRGIASLYSRNCKNKYNFV